MTSTIFKLTPEFIENLKDLTDDQLGLEAMRLTAYGRLDAARELYRLREELSK